MATRAPACARPRAIPKPMPPLPPVTSAAFPVRLKRLAILHLRSIEEVGPGLFSNREPLLSLRVNESADGRKYTDSPQAQTGSLGNRASVVESAADLPLDTPRAAQLASVRRP